MDPEIDPLPRYGRESAGSTPSDSDEASSKDDQNAQASSTSEDESDTVDPRTAKMQPKQLSDSSRAAMREILSTEHKAVAASMVQAAQEDIVKGGAVLAQRSAHNAFLNTRIRLQKALIATNSLPPSENTSELDSTHAALEAGETNALKLLNTVSVLQGSLTRSSEKKRSYSTAFKHSTPSSDINNALASSHSEMIPQYRTILGKWSAKTQASSGRPQHDKFGATTKEPLLSVLDSQLSGSMLEKNISRTHVPRSCAPLQSMEGLTSDEQVYDDADFYTLLLQEFIEGRSTGSGGGTELELDVEITTLRRTNKAQKKLVDTKASKGRKLRYTVHEKLLNFMAPRDLGTWGERQTNDFFASLLGRKVQGGLGEDVRDEEEEHNEDSSGNIEMGGIRLFRST